MIELTFVTICIVVFGFLATMRKEQNRQMREHKKWKQDNDLQ